MRKIYSLILSVLIFAASGFGQTTVTINCTGTTGSYNSGTVTSSGTKADGNMVDIDGNSSTKKQGWASFDLSSIPSGSTVNSVTFKFTVYSNNAASGVTNEISGFTGTPSSMTGATLYNNIVNGTVLNSSTWDQNSTNSKTFNAAGITFISNNLGGTCNIGLWRGNGSSLFRIGGYPYASPPQLVINYTAPASITTGTINPSTYCAGDPVSVPFTSSGTFTSGNDYTAQLSNASGSFSSPTNIGNLNNTSAISGTISATIPAATATGNGYRIRVISNSPAVTGSANV